MLKSLKIKKGFSEITAWFVRKRTRMLPSVLRILFTMNKSFKLLLVLIEH